MSQPAGLTRARSLFGNPVVTRVRRLAATHATGTLPFATGALYFADGDITGADSERTPPAAGISPPLAEDPPSRQVTALLGRTEPVVDAALDLLSGEARYGRFRPADRSSAPMPPAIPADALLTEVFRRQRLLRRMSAVLTPDSTIARNPALDAEAIRVSALQWALLIRIGDGTTPRGLALELDRSVFGTVVEIYRLLAVGLVRVPGHAYDALPGLSYILAVDDVRQLNRFRPSRTRRSTSGDSAARADAAIARSPLVPAPAAPAEQRPARTSSPIS
jgi:hypothetical protein